MCINLCTYICVYLSKYAFINTIECYSVCVNIYTYPQKLTQFLWVCVCLWVYIYIYIYISSSCRAGSMDIPDPLSPLLPIVHRTKQVYRTTSCILT